MIAADYTGRDHTEQGEGMLTLINAFPLAAKAIAYFALQSNSSFEKQNC